MPSSSSTHLVRQTLCFSHMRLTLCIAAMVCIICLSAALGSGPRNPYVTVEPSCAFSTEHPGINTHLKSVIMDFVPGQRVWCVAVPSFGPAQALVCGEFRVTPHKNGQYGITRICFKEIENSISDKSLTQKCTISKDTWFLAQSAFTSVVSRAHFEFSPTAGLDGSMYYFFVETREGRLFAAQKWSPEFGPPALLVEIVGLLDAYCTLDGKPQTSAMSTNIQKLAEEIIRWDYEESHRQYQQHFREQQEQQLPALNIIRGQSGAEKIENSHSPGAEEQDQGR